MPAIDIPDPLPPAITPPRTVIEFLVDQDLEDFGGNGLVELGPWGGRLQRRLVGGAFRSEGGGRWRAVAVEL